MRMFNQLVFDDFVVGTTSVYTDPKWNSLLGTYEKGVIHAIVDQVTGTNPTLTVQVEFSGDNRNFGQKDGTAEINAGALVATGTNQLVGADATLPSLAFVRLRIQMGGTVNPTAHVKLYVTGRGEQGGG